MIPGSTVRAKTHSQTGTETLMTTLNRPSSPRGGRPTRAGFTLIEVLVVLVLIGVLTAVAAPGLDRFDFQIKAASQELVTRIAAAKHMSVLKQHDVVLGFDAANRRIRIHSDRDSDGTVDSNEDVRFYELPDDVGFGRGSAPSFGGYSNALNLSQTKGGLPTLTFHRNGSASEETAFYFTSLRAARNNGFPEDARAVEVGRATGTISCRSYATSSWRQGC